MAELKSKRTLETAPVFVFGAVRSGTTVFRLMLNAHSDLSNLGEVDFLFDYLERRTSEKNTDWHYRIEELKNDRIFRSYDLHIPEGVDGLALLESFLEQLAGREAGTATLNLHRHLNRVHDILPKARFIHLLRDPRDVARSSIAMGWSGTVYCGVNNWVDTENSWETLTKKIPQSQVIELKYENLITETEAELRRICAFTNVPYQPEMLLYHESTTYGPPDISLVEQWRHKLTPRNIALVEGKAMPLMQLRGYEPAGQGYDPNRLEKLWLLFVNRYGIWKTGVRRYGIKLFFSEKITRRLGLVEANKPLRDEIQELSKTYIK